MEEEMEAEASLVTQREKEHWVDKIIFALLAVRRARGIRKSRLTESEIAALCATASQIFLEQPNLLELHAPLKICGDIHGQFSDLRKIFFVAGYPPTSNYLFLGDYVDRGSYGIETLCLLLAYKVKYPENFFLLRGNHESASMNMTYGFYEECERRYSAETWNVFIKCFDCMPLAALVEDRILCMHGGLSPRLQNLDQIRCIPRPSGVPASGLACDLVWSDPDPRIKGWAPSTRNVSYCFGSDVVNRFLKKHDLDFIVRAHQVVDDGFELFADGGLVTVFSAPNYCGASGNSAAILCVDVNLECRFQIIQPTLSSLSLACLAPAPMHVHMKGDVLPLSEK